MPLDPTQTVISSIFVFENRLYVGLADYRVVIIDLESMEIIRTITEDLWEVKAIFVDKDYLYVASLNEKVNIYNHRYQLIHQIHHNLGVISLHVDDQFIYTGSYDGMVTVWDKREYSKINNLEGHAIRVNTISCADEFIFTGDGFTVKTASIKMWRRTNHELVTIIAQNISKRVNCIIFWRNKMITGHGGPGELQIRELPDEKLISSIETKYDVKSICVNQNLILCVVRDELQIYDQSSLKLLHRIQNQQHEVNTCTFFQNQIIYSARNLIKIIDPTNFDLIKELIIE